MKKSMSLKKSSLREYNRKRDFGITKEPSGEEDFETSTAPIFVVQEHHASHLHYDFRLELDGVLKSWAVPKGPSMHLEDKRLAVEVEDHPLSYAKFHGTIPEGEYGAGKVYIWDSGTWKVKGDPHTSLKKGKLEFSLKGKKLKGNFVLVRLPDKGSSKHNWLLMKRPDEKALKGKEERAEAIAPKRKVAAKKIVASKVATKKTQTKKIAKTSHDKWPGFIQPQLALLVDTPPSSESYVHEIKFDGYRLQIHIKGGQVKLFTRNGLDWTRKFPHLKEQFEKLNFDDAILDGEAVVQDSRGRSNFGLLQDALSNEDDTPVAIFLFDLLYQDGEDLRDKPLRERKDRLKQLIPKKHECIYYSLDVNQDAEKFFKLSCEHHLEGIVSKDETAPYTKGRTSVWCKTKCTHRQELVVGGYTTGKGARSAEVGALLLGVYERDKFRYVGKVGSGFNRQSLKEIKERVRKLEQQKSAFDLNSPKGKEIHWLKPKLVAEVDFTEWTSDKHLRHPVFIGLRDDKKTKDIVEEKETHLEPQTVELSHPEKVLYPKEKLTKQDVLNYYDSVAEVMLPYSEGRPLSLVRCPNGSDKKCFYQKHPGSGQLSKNFYSFKVKEKTQTNTYVAMHSKESLHELVQMNAYEIHTWNSHYQSIMNPDQIVMDFDPDPSVPFKEVVKAAVIMKKILEQLKLKSFVKTSGGKGLHVHIPIAPLYSWDEIKAFSKAIADEMVSRNPELYLSTMSKKERKGKIFIDYLRNGFGATAVAPYSLRAKSTSSVAMPLEWKELETLKSPDEFTMKKALQKIKNRKSDPWKKMLSLKQKIYVISEYTKKQD